MQHICAIFNKDKSAIAIYYYSYRPWLTTETMEGGGGHVGPKIFKVYGSTVKLMGPHTTPINSIKNKHLYVV